MVSASGRIAYYLHHSGFLQLCSHGVSAVRVGFGVTSTRVLLVAVRSGDCVSWNWISPGRSTDSIGTRNSAVCAKTLPDAGRALGNLCTAVG